MVKRCLCMAVVLLMLQSCTGSGHLHKVGPSASCAANTTYTGILDYPVTLVNGRWEGEPFVPGGASRLLVGLMDGFALSGDLDGDDQDELAVVLWESSGGSGTFYYLAVLGDQGSGCVNMGTSLIGDRIRVEGGRIGDGKIELHVVRQGPDDPACCPSQRGVMSWRLRHGRLVRID